MEEFDLVDEKISSLDDDVDDLLSELKREVRL
jgi:hypothetical protein